MELPWSLVNQWIPRVQQIFPAEAFAPLMAVLHHGAELRGRDIYVFIDNEAAASAVIRGATRAGDVGLIVQALHWKLHLLSARVWVEWIDSKSNPSDGLSRDGLTDAWTLEQEWDLEEASPCLIEESNSFKLEMELTLGLG
jgi:hypothetical protein